MMDNYVPEPPKNVRIVRLVDDGWRGPKIVDVILWDASANRPIGDETEYDIEIIRLE